MLNKSRNIYLIGGAPTTGKSTVAQHVASHFYIPWISSDQIRDIMRVTATKDIWPGLFNASEYTAERFLTELSMEEIIRLEIEQGEEAWLGVKYMIESDYTWEDGFVVEGVNVLPHLVNRDFADKSHVKAVFLTIGNEDHIRDTVFNRGLWSDANTYPDAVKEKEVEWVVGYNEYIKKESNKYGYPVFETKRQKEDIAAILQLLK